MNYSVSKISPLFTWRHRENSVADSLIFLDKLRIGTHVNINKLDSIKPTMKNFLSTLSYKPLVISGPIAAGKVS